MLVMELLALHRPPHRKGRTLNLREEILQWQVNLRSLLNGTDLL